jgi:hypothetical protein
VQREPIYIYALNNNMLRNIQELSCLILARYLPEQYRIYKADIDLFFATILRLADERGLPFAVKYVKSSRLAVTRKISGHPLSALEGVALASDGWPVWLSWMRTPSQSGEGIKLVLTLLTSLRGIHLPPTLDITPIISPWKGTDTITDRELNHACRQLGVSSRKADWSSFHMSTKSGPLGQALLTSATELTLLPQELLDDIITVGGSKLGKVVGALKAPRFGDLSIAGIWANLFPPKTGSFRKISYFSDKEGKTRVIAILDYWSQTALRPLHSVLNNMLRRIKCDCTYNQGAFTRILSSSGPFHSLDLSNATDRMPIAVQLRVLTRIVGSEKALAWSRILVGWEYTSKGSPAVKYSAGQPMGAYSSWPVMALTHHILVRVAAQRAGKPHFNAYTLLGDDIVIADDSVAMQYRVLLSQLDMPISEAKTHVSVDTFEFAKRWIHKGEEVTGFSIAGLGNVWKRYSLLHNYLATQQDHGWNLTLDQHPGLVSDIYRFYGKSEQGARAVKLYMLFDSVAYAKHTGDHSRIISVLTEFFGMPSEQLTLRLSGEFSTQRLGEVLRVEAAKRLVERDFRRFQRDAYSVSAKLTGHFLKKFRGLSVQDYRAALRGNHPLVTVLNGMILESASVLRNQFGKAVGITTARSSQYQAIAGNPEVTEVPDQTYLSVGLSKYFVSKGVFTMRASHAISLADSQVCKLILDISRELIAGKWVPPSKEVVPSTEVAPSGVHRVIEGRVIPTGPTIYLMAPS